MKQVHTTAVHEPVKSKKSTDESATKSDQYNKLKNINTGMFHLYCDH